MRTHLRKDDDCITLSGLSFVAEMNLLPPSSLVILVFVCRASFFAPFTFLDLVFQWFSVCYLCTVCAEKGRISLHLLLFKILFLNRSLALFVLC